MGKFYIMNIIFDTLFLICTGYFGYILGQEKIIEKMLEAELKKARTELKEKIMELSDKPSEFIHKSKVINKIGKYEKERKKAGTKEGNDLYVNYIDALQELLND